MNKPKDKIEELFQSHINDFDKMPDDSLWADIEANLPPEVSPVYRLKRWGLAAALLLFSLIGFVAYQSQGVWQKIEPIGLKENKSKNKIDSPRPPSKKESKTASETNESTLEEEQVPKSILADRETKNDKVIVIDDITLKDKISNSNKPEKWQKNKASITLNPGIKLSELPTQERHNMIVNEKRILESKDAENHIAATVSENNQIKDSGVINRVGEGNGHEQTTIARADDWRSLSDIDYLSTHGDITSNIISLNTTIAYEAEHHPKAQKESFFKAPNELYVSLTPSLNYYRVFSNAMINQFNGADNGGRVGWALQAGAVYPLKFRRLRYRVGLSYFSAKSNFRYSVVNRTQLPIRLNNNTFEYVNVESLQSESRKWQLLEIQNDLMYKIRPMQDFILGFKAGSSFTEKPVFDAYTGYRFSKQVSSRQVLWIEAAYAYAINAQKSSTHTFSYHMDKYSLRIGLNFR
jgi:hypothetical protein